MKNLIIIVSVLMISGCVGVYKQPDESYPHATITLKKGINNLEVGGVQAFHAYDNSECIANYGAALGAISWNTAPQKLVRIPAGEKIYIATTTMGDNVNSELCGSQKFKGVCHEVCINLSSFIPKEGEDYSVQQIFRNGSCQTLLINNETKSPPLSLERHKVNKQCY